MERSSSCLDPKCPDKKPSWWQAEFIEPAKAWHELVSSGFDAIDERIPNSTTPRPNGYRKSILREMTLLENSALTEYTKMAGVGIPGRGKSNHLYSEDEARKILNAIIANCRDKQAVAQCKKSLDTLT